MEQVCAICDPSKVERKKGNQEAWRWRLRVVSRAEIEQSSFNSCTRFCHCSDCMMRAMRSMRRASSSDGWKFGSQRPPEEEEEGAGAEWDDS
jgi:hypothetical protein